MIILFSGRAGVGKSTSARLLKDCLFEYNQYVEIHPLASEVKSLAYEFGWDGNKDERGRQLLINIGTVTGRAYDPDIWVKRVLKDITNNLDNQKDYAIIDDWRFPNEAEYLEQNSSHKIIRIRIEAPNREMLKGTSNYNDISEISLPSDFIIKGEPLRFQRYKNYGQYYDYVIDNTGTIEQLENIIYRLGEELYARTVPN